MAEKTRTAVSREDAEEAVRTLLRWAGDDPARDVETVAAAVEGDHRLVQPGLRRHQRDRGGRHVGRVGDDDVHASARSGGSAA